jgi:hypothetical protein
MERNRATEQAGGVSLNGTLPPPGIAAGGGVNAPPVAPKLSWALADNRLERLRAVPGWPTGRVESAQGSGGPPAFLSSPSEPVFERAAGYVGIVIGHRGGRPAAILAMDEGDGRKSWVTLTCGAGGHWGVAGRAEATEMGLSELLLDLGPWAD